MFQDFSQLARYTSATPRGGGYFRNRDLSLPKLERNQKVIHTEKISYNTTSDFFATTPSHPFQAEMNYLEVILKYGDTSALDEKQRQSRQDIIAYLDLYLKMDFIATTTHDSNNPVPFSLIEFLVERTAGFTLAQSIFTQDTDLNRSEALRNWSQEHGLDQEELALLINPLRSSLKKARKASMSHHFTGLRSASMKRRKGLLNMHLFFPEVIDTEIFSYRPIIVTSY